jgi:hypothetical protein
MDSEQLLDWANLPGGATEVSLWPTLHDGSLIRLSSDLLARNMVLQFDVDYVREFNKLPEGTLFEFLLSNVTSARALRFAIWPGECVVHARMSREEQTRAVEEYQSKGREETEDWQTFESSLGVNDVPEVSNAVVAAGQGRIALKIGLLMDDDSYREIFMRAVKASVSNKVFIPSSLVFVTITGNRDPGSNQGNTFRIWSSSRQELEWETFAMASARPLLGLSRATCAAQSVCSTRN